LREKERREVYLLAINYCIRRFNVGKKEFLQAAFDLYRRGLEDRSLFENGVLSKFTYKNVVSAGIGLQNFGWVRQFIDDYRAFLPVREQTAIYNYNLAVYYFRLPDYDAAMTLLRDGDFGSDTMTQLDARSMLLRVYFEKGYEDALDSLLDSFSVYLRRQKQLGYQRENYMNLIRFTKRLLILSATDKVGAAALRKEIEGVANVAERGWLLMKVK
jgi:hypothetical protein